MCNRTRLATLVVLIAAPVAMRAVAQDESRPPVSLYDPRLGELRRASVAWDNRPGPARVVIDQVALVPDVPAFFDAIASWDEGHWFPILIDDAETTPKFLRAFRPARIVRFPGRPKPLAPKEMWESAVIAVGRSWLRDPAGPPEEAVPAESSGVLPGPAPTRGEVRKKGPRGDVLPDWLGPTPPGAVLSAPDSPSLAGGVALAAGRFQPLIRWNTAARRGKVLNEVEARQLALDMETALAEVVPRYAALGDACDFLTIAADYPDRYTITGVGLKGGPAAFDDLIGRDRESLRRWAYAGRLIGSPAESVYRAMCSLFLQPKSALLFDAYNEAEPGFRAHVMRTAATRLPRDLSVKLVSGPKADLDGWYRTLGRENPFGLVYVNTMGGPFNFTLSGGRNATSGDIPPSVPAVVLMNHSNSAADPHDPKTLGGAWMSGGAFLYFGAQSEPYLAAFRTPTLVSSLLNEGLPIAACVRMGPDESAAFGTPWRLHLLGDPLYRVNPRGAKAPRSAEFPSTSYWPPYRDEPPPTGPAATDVARLAWAVKATILQAASGEAPQPDLESALLTIRRQALPANVRPFLDRLRVDALATSKAHRGEFLALLTAIPPGERSPGVSRAIDSARFERLQDAIDRKDLGAACETWDDLVRSEIQKEMKDEVTRRVAGLADRLMRLAAWRAHLNNTLKGREDAPEAPIVNAELERLEKLGVGSIKPSVRRGG